MDGSAKMQHDFCYISIDDRLLILQLEIGFAKWVLFISLRKFRFPNDGVLMTKSTKKEIVNLEIIYISIL